MAENSQPFDDRVKGIIEEYLSDTNNLPKKFKSWIPEYVTISEPALHLESMVGNLNANRIAANSISADKLDAVLALVSALLAGSPTGSRVEIGYGITLDGDGNAVVDNSFTGIRAYDGDGNLIFKLDAGGGTAQFKGRVTFGTSSKLTTNDMIEVVEQPGAALATPTLEQSASATGLDEALLLYTLDADPTSGNELILVVTIWDEGGSPTITTPTGYTLINSHTFGGSSRGRQAAYRKVSDGTDAEGNITLSGSTDLWIVEAFEFSGVSDVEDGSSSNNNGSSSPASSGTTGTITQSDLVFAAFAIEGNYSSIPLINPRFDALDADYTQVSNTVKKASGIQLVSECATKIASSGTEAAQVTLKDVDAWGGLIFTLKAASNSVTSATADSARLYATDVSSQSVLHVVDENGNQNSLALAPAGNSHKEIYLAGTLNMASRSGHNGGTETLSLSGAVVGDIVKSLQVVDATDVRPFLIHPEPVVTVNDQVQLVVFNTDSVSRDPASTTFHVVLLRRT